MLSREQFRSIEGRLYHYEDMKSSIASYQDAQCQLRAAQASSLPRGQALRSDPTALGALALAEPPASIDQSIRWVAAIDRALHRLSGQSTQLGEIARSYYLRSSDTPVRQRIGELCQGLNIDKASFNQYRRCIVHSVYLQALYEHLLTPDETAIQALMTT